MTEFTFTPQPGTVYFVGAGPGAPDLITVRGRDIIAQADLILYADSLVADSVASLARKPQARVMGTSGMHLAEFVALMTEAARAGEVVARVHSGDPALYGATFEQMARLDDEAVPYEIVPGVTAAFAAAAYLKTELTVPELVQSIILTRIAGRTPMPEGEELRALAAPGASLAIYLSIGRTRQVVEELLASGGYQPDTPVAALYKVTWPDQQVVIGTLADIADKVRAAGFSKHTLLLVSPALDATLKSREKRVESNLYSKHYTHRLRKAVDFQRGKKPNADLVVGIGCRRDTPAEDLLGALAETLDEAGLHLNRVRAIATVDLKADEPGLLALVEELDLPLTVLPQAELLAAFPAGSGIELTPSAAQDKFNLPGVAEPCALLAAGDNARLLVPKRRFAHCTVAVAQVA